MLRRYQGLYGRGILSVTTSKQHQRPRPRPLPADQIDVARLGTALILQNARVEMHRETAMRVVVSGRWGLIRAVTPDSPEWDAAAFEAEVDTRVDMSALAWTQALV